eukprot:Seg14146.2 transcript_id=Seg14146.2/GoldUCD/mRNA.D3Y31 product="hypothetical protein" protein_id=Seg14146.2/GoldUCD/D3Y31
MIPLTEEALVGGLAFFVENGTTVDAVTVSQSAKPDTDPETNWDQFGCINAVKFQSEKKSFGTKKCFDGVNYSEREVTRNVRDEIMLNTQDMNAYVQRLQYGLAANPVAGGAEVNAFADSDRKIWGWLKLQGHRVGVGTVAVAVDLWGYLELEEGYEWKDELNDIALKFTHVPGSALGSPIKFTAPS